MLRFKIVVSGILAGILLLAFLDLWYQVSWVWYVVLVLVGMGCIVSGSFLIRMNFYLKAIHKGPHSSGRAIAITFDDGPSSEYTDAVLKLLNQYGARATFFLIGKQAENHTGLVKRIFQSGHTIGNHSYSHDMLIDFKSSHGWEREISQTDAVINTITGESSRYFRPPYGVTTPHLARAINRTGHQVIGWNIRSFDTQGNDPKRIVSRITRQLVPGSIILLHDTHPRILSVLEHLLLFLQENNYHCVGIDTLLHEQ